MREILEGVIDLHVHCGPSCANRELCAGEMAQKAAKFGYKGFLIKDHYFPTIMSAVLMEKHFGSGNLKVFGSLALNNSVGLFNLKAIDVACQMGAKIIYMPTVSSKNHIDKHKGKMFAGGGQATIDEKPVYYLDDEGNLLPEVVKVLTFIASKEDLILGTGHGTPDEIDALIHQAVSLGIKKILVNHPYYIIDADIDLIKNWVKMGVFIELNACQFTPSSKWFSFPIRKIVEILEIVPIEQLITCSDLGQRGNIGPVEGMYELLMLLLKEVKMTESQINMVSKVTPARLVGIQ